MRVSRGSIGRSVDEIASGCRDNGRINAVHAGDTDVFARYSRFAIGAKVTVLPRNDNFRWPNPAPFNYIDEHVFARLEKLRIAPSELCDDETFLRRVTLDLSGVPPTVEEYRAFMADTRPDKRNGKRTHQHAGGGCKPSSLFSCSLTTE